MQLNLEQSHHKRNTSDTRQGENALSPLRGEITARVDLAISILDESALRPWDEQELLRPHYPIKIGVISDTASFDGSPGEDLEVNELTLKKPDEDSLHIPEEYLAFCEAINMAFHKFRQQVPNWIDYFAKLTIRRGTIPAGTSQKNRRGTYTDKVHIDGPQLDVAPAARYPGDIVYIASNNTPTICYSQPFHISPSDMLDERSMLDAFTSQAREENASPTENYALYEIDPFLPHRASYASIDVHRTFFRLRFTLKAAYIKPDPVSLGSR